MNALLEAGIARVCCVCHPGDSLFQVRPEWRAAGVQLSHGYCAACLRAAKASLDAALADTPEDHPDFTTLTGPAFDPSQPREGITARHGSSPSPARSLSFLPGAGASAHLEPA